MRCADTVLVITTGRYTAEACREAACDAGRTQALVWLSPDTSPWRRLYGLGMVYLGRGNGRLIRCLHLGMMSVR